MGSPSYGATLLQDTMRVINDYSAVPPGPNRVQSYISTPQFQPPRVHVLDYCPYPRRKLPAF